MIDKCSPLTMKAGEKWSTLDLDAFTWINTMIGNVKNSLHGTDHHISAEHLPRSLAECCNRFNRRFKLEDMLLGRGYTAVRTPMPQRLLNLAEAWG
jgi:hypothetical protein